MWLRLKCIVPISILMKCVDDVDSAAGLRRRWVQHSVSLRRLGSQTGRHCTAPGVVMARGGGDGGVSALLSINAFGFINTLAAQRYGLSQNSMPLSHDSLQHSRESLNFYKFTAVENAGILLVDVSKKSSLKLTSCPSWTHPRHSLYWRNPVLEP